MLRKIKLGGQSLPLKKLGLGGRPDGSRKDPWQEGKVTDQAKGMLLVSEATHGSGGSGRRET